MPGTNAGTGQPITFLCGKGRRAGGFFGGQGWAHGDYVRTGRVRTRASGGGVRTLRDAHEYRCRCGHVGWSRHKGVLRYPVERSGTSSPATP
jgi:hypothetical protein